ncbi:hypothetical protein Sde_1053 [Saccharophagus degradans 2-40]|uniref:Uncharacterized protein n=1 Tax=Saccharophagus degradans (strain 2-40 / ATCC 43961 / DSM 17024) TaxID=203122 RepID=Q21LW4_SACD2|nr:hypothetical protein Sde_1053 [Saccharophagus degradans 2-40]
MMCESGGGVVLYGWKQKRQSFFGSAFINWCPGRCAGSTSTAKRMDARERLGRSTRMGGNEKRQSFFGSAFINWCPGRCAGSTSTAKRMDARERLGRSARMGGNKKRQSCLALSSLIGAQDDVQEAQVPRSVWMRESG